jgi:hypothetical protein
VCIDCGANAIVEVAAQQRTVPCEACGGVMSVVPGWVEQGESAPPTPQAVEVEPEARQGDPSSPERTVVPLAEFQCLCLECGKTSYVLPPMTAKASSCPHCGARSLRSLEDAASIDLESSDSGVRSLRAAAIVDALGGQSGVWEVSDARRPATRQASLSDYKVVCVDCGKSDVLLPPAVLEESGCGFCGGALRRGGAEPDEPKEPASLAASGEVVLTPLERRRRGISRYESGRVAAVSWAKQEPDALSKSSDRWRSSSGVTTVGRRVVARQWKARGITPRPRPPKRGLGRDVLVGAALALLITSAGAFFMDWSPPIASLRADRGDAAATPARPVPLTEPTPSLPPRPPRPSRLKKPVEGKKPAEGKKPVEGTTPIDPKRPRARRRRPAADPAELRPGQEPAETGDEEDEVAGPPPPVVECFDLLGRGAEGAADVYLRDVPLADGRAAALETLEASDVAVRVIGAADYLGRAEVRSGVTSDGWPRLLRGRLEGTPDAKLLPALIEALGCVGSERDLESLLQLVRRGELALAPAAARGLCRGPRGIRRLLEVAEELLVEETRRELPDGKERLGVALGALRAAAMSRTRHGVEFVVALGEATPPFEILQLATFARTRAALEELVGLAEALLDSEDPGEREVAVRLFVTTRDREAGELILYACTDPAPRVRAAAARATYPLAVKGAVEQLVPMLDDPDAEVRQSVYATLKRITKQRFTGRRAQWAAWLKSRPPEDG